MAYGIPFWQEDRRDANPRQEYWGESYGPQLKQRLLKPVFDKLETEEKIGNLIIDVGSGAPPVTQLLKTKPARKRICVDIAADNVGSLDDLRIRLDAEKVEQFGTLSFRKAILGVCAFLEIKPKAEAKTERADTIVFSDTLNYVDFGKVLNGFAKYLKPDGRIIVLNLPHRGNRSRFGPFMFSVPYSYFVEALFSLRWTMLCLHPISDWPTRCGSHLLFCRIPAAGGGFRG
jgi:hypothetical protein